MRISESAGIAQVKALLPSSSCVVWPGEIGRDGYALLSRSGRKSVAHRAVYEALVGPIPVGAQLDHLCKNRSCVNPAHLEPVSPAENSARARESLTSVDPRTHCIHGHPMTEENTYRKPNGHRQCRACNRAAVERYARRRRALSASVALAGVALVGVTVPAFATGNHEKPSVCHPTGKGYVLIRPAQASSHIDESAYPNGHYWKHEHSGRHDVYAVNGACPVTPSPTNTGGTPSPTTSYTATASPTTATTTTSSATSQPPSPTSTTGQPTTTSPSPSQTSSTPSASTLPPVSTSTSPATTSTPRTTSVEPSSVSPAPASDSSPRAPSPRRSVPSTTVAPPEELAHTGFDRAVLLAGLGIILVGGLMHGARVLGGRNGRH